MLGIYGRAKKMTHKIGNPVEYSLVLGEHHYPINEFIGSDFSLQFTGNIHCVACNRQISKAYQQGFCFPCTQRLAQCDLCILKPHLCHFDAGTCREPQWGDKHCNTAHIVYLANTSGLKIGVTRASQIPTRWIDQGAHQALPIFKVKRRLQAGLIEELIATKINDRTNWRNMLKGLAPTLDLAAERDLIFSEFAGKIQAIAQRFNFGDIEFLTNEEVVDLKYPVHTYPQKINSLNLAKTPLITNKLLGIKGQYLIFEHGVLNIRNYTGYELAI